MAATALQLYISRSSPIPNPPNAVIDKVATPEETPITINVLDNDTDPNGSSLIGHSIRTVYYGTATLSDDHLSITYISEPNYHGWACFKYVITNGTFQDIARVCIDVMNVPDAPIEIFADCGTLTCNFYKEVER